MSHFYRRSVLQERLRVLNQREDRDLQHKLNLLDRQYRSTCRQLQHRRDSLMDQEDRVVMVKVCEPKATVSIALKEIAEHSDTHFSRGIYTSDGGRLGCNESDPAERGRSISAPPPSIQPTGSVRRRGNIRSSLSLMQMKNIAAIDSISEREEARRRQRAREEMEQLRRLQWETLHQRVTAFIEKLQNKGNVELMVEPP